MEEINIHDLYEGAYLLCAGLKMKDLTVLGSNGRKLCTFTFEGDRAVELSDEYKAGRATVNLALLKFTMEKLKDRMFEKIREMEEREKRHGAGREDSTRESKRKEHRRCRETARRSGQRGRTPWNR